MANELFDAAPATDGEPLASRMRPRSLDEFVGQDHIIGPGRLLRRAIAADQLSSIILYGPPGTGKTTIARIIANSTKSRFQSLNAVLSGVANIRNAIDEANNVLSLYGERTILFVDEVHRWNKSQQDALLPWVENGVVILVGATTENPFFEVNKALVSRSRIFQLVPLENADLFSVARMALKDGERGYGRWTVEFEDGALEHLVDVSAGDARTLLNALQLAVETTPDTFPPPDGERIFVSRFAAEESIQRKAVLYDKEGDYHFDTISAFIKSIRGSDPDAALYWMALMIRAGEDSRYIFRRMLISACEDVGLAAPEALGVVESCAAAFDRVGLPEGQYHLIHACLYLATAPKSNSSLSFFDAMKAVNEKSRDVPNHLKDASRDAKAFGHGDGYKYPHSWKAHWVAQQYLPDGLKGRIFYQPGELGYEAAIRQSVLNRRMDQTAVMLEENDSADRLPNGLTFSPGDDERSRWVKRTDINSDTVGIGIRDTLMKQWQSQRHQRVFIPSDPGGLLIWEAVRRVPEGGVTALCATQSARESLQWLAENLPEPERPRLIVGRLTMPGVAELLDSTPFDVILARNWLGKRSPEERLNLLETLGKLAAKSGRLFLAENVPGGTTLSQLLPPGALGGRESAFQEAEAAFMASLAIDNDASALTKLISAVHWTDVRVERHEVREERELHPAQLNNWFQPDRKGSYGAHMSAVMGGGEWEETSALAKQSLANRTVLWTSCFLIVRALRQ